MQSDEVLVRADQMMLGEEQPSTMLSDQVKSQRQEEDEKVPVQHGKFQVISMQPSKRHRKIAMGGQTIYSNANSIISNPSGLGPTNLTIEKHYEGRTSPVISNASPREADQSALT